MDEFPGNAHKKKATPATSKEKGEIEKVVTGEVIQKKPPILQRIKSVFFDGDAHSVTRYLAQEVLMPAIRNLIVDSTTKGIEKMIYGESQTPRHGAGAPRYSYNNPIHRASSAPARPPSAPRGRNAVPDLIVSSREEADVVIERLGDIIQQYGVASLADLYDLVGLPNSHVDNKWGWYDLIYANVRQVRDGFLIELPPADPI